jgi:hypothetical protein
VAEEERNLSKEINFSGVGKLNLSDEANMNDEEMKEFLIEMKFDLKHIKKAVDDFSCTLYGKGDKNEGLKYEVVKLKNNVSFINKLLWIVSSGALIALVAAVMELILK